MTVLALVAVGFALGYLARPAWHFAEMLWATETWLRRQRRQAQYRAGVIQRPVLGAGDGPPTSRCRVESVRKGRCINERDHHGTDHLYPVDLGLPHSA